MICPFCKAEIPDNAKFCTSCGRIVPHTDRMQNTEQNFSADGNFANQEYKPSQHNRADPDLAEVIKRLDSMNVLQIICLVLLFIPFLNIIGSVIFLVILIMSLGLTNRVSAVFSKYGYPMYAKITDGVRSKCIFMLACIPITIIMSFMISGMDFSKGQDFAVSVLIGFFLILFGMAILFTIYEVYCFCRLYTVKNALEMISIGNRLPEKPGSGAAIIAIVLVLFFFAITILGIIAAIALPAYARYMERARFGEVAAAANGVMRQAELCVAEFGENDIAGRCDNTREVQGSGWALLAPKDYSTKYVDSISVSAVNADSSRSGHAEITVTSHGVPLHFKGRNADITIIGTVVNDRVTWNVSSDSSCKHLNLC